MTQYEDNKGTDRIAQWMQQLANDPLESSHRTLPDPDMLWMKAYLLDRQTAAERSLKPVQWCETIARILVGFAACWLAFDWTKTWSVAAGGFLSPTLLSLAVSVVLTAIAMAAYPIWAGDSE